MIGIVRLARPGAGRKASAAASGNLWVKVSVQKRLFVRKVCFVRIEHCLERIVVSELRECSERLGAHLVLCIKLSYTDRLDGCEWLDLGAARGIVAA